MKKQFGLIIILLLSITIFFSSCEKLFEDPETNNDEYLESYSQIKIISQNDIDVIYAYLTVLYPGAELIKEQATNAVKVFKISYNTTFQDEPVIASGMVCVPIGFDTYPILSYQNGTNTLHSNAPSVNPDWELYEFLETVASAGFILSIPDYIGFGSSDDKFHPYLHKESSNRCIIDMLLATKELLASHNLNISYTNDLYITGYSMGGWANLQLQKVLENDYEDEFNLKASASAAGPYNLIYINNYVLGSEDYPMPYFLGYMLDSYSKIGSISNDITDIINEPYASRIPLLYNGTNDGDYINEQLTTSVSELFTQKYINGFIDDIDFSSVRSTLLNNSINAWNVSTPTVLLHGEDDLFVPAQGTINLYNDFINLGVSEDMVQLVIFPEVDHPEGIIPCGLTAVNWFIDIKNQTESISE